MAKNDYLLCCDWGTSSFRLRLVDTKTYHVLAEENTADGIATTFTRWQASGAFSKFDFFAMHLRKMIDVLSRATSKELTNTPLLVSGMASSSIGMEELPYAELPFALDGSGVEAKVFRDFNGSGNPLILVSGVRSQDDVMRGEEAQLIGLFALEETSKTAQEASIFIFPGTHSKHIQAKGSFITGFRTFMTGELFNLLSEQSILKDSVENNGDFSEPEANAAFVEGVRQSRASGLSSKLFTVRTNQLFQKFGKRENSFFLSGLLIGSELQELIADTKARLVVCSGELLFKPYQVAIDTLGLSAQTDFISSHLIDRATIAGQVQIAKTHYGKQA